MTTALDIITRSLLDIQVIQGGESPSADESADALAYLKDILASWDNEGLMCYSELLGATAIDGSVAYFVGTGQTFNIPAPPSIDAVYFISNGYTYPLSEVNMDQYVSIPDKTVSGNPDRYFIYYNPAGSISPPYHAVHIFPVPTTGTLEIAYKFPLSQVLDYSTVLKLPPGYERALRLELGVELMPMYNKNNPLLIERARKAKSDIKRLNSANNRVISGLGLPYMGGRSSNIFNLYQ